MQSQLGGPATGGSDSPFTKIGYYLWLLAIGAIVYAYVFATSASASSYRGINTTTDPVTGAPMDNVGNQVSLLLGAILAYMGLVKLWSTGQSQFTNAWIAPVGNAIIAFGLLIGLAFVSIRATQYSINLNKITAQDSLGFFGSNISLMGVIPIALVIMAKLNNWDWSSAIYDTLLHSAQFVLNFWFPLVMMYYFIRLGDNRWLQIVAGVSLSITILLMCYNWYDSIGNGNNTVGVMTVLKQMIAYLFITLPFAPYLKYAENTDLLELAKWVMVFALLCYVAYLMFNVYKFKNHLVPCAGTDVASCFDLRDWVPTFGDSDGSKDTPYVNALVWTLGASVGINVLNWLLQWASIYNRINGLANGTTTATPLSSMPWYDKIMQLLKLVLFPVYWTLSLFVNYPVATVGAVLVVAAVMLLLYRSSFDLTAFVEGQRGTVITLFTMFIASLVVFGGYIYMKSPTADIAQDTITYGQFIGKTGVFIAIAVCIVGLIGYFLNSHSKLTSTVSVVQFGITAMIYITGIAIVLSMARFMFSNRRMGSSLFQINPVSNWVINLLKLFGNMLFYLPCLMLDFVDTLKEQYRLTTQTALILLALEAAFILAGHLLPSAVASAINHTGVQILSAPISMNAPVTITTYDVQFVNAHGVIDNIASIADGATTTVALHNYIYGVSAWFYIHPQPPNMNANYDSDKYINMLQLGARGPSIQYNPKNNALQFSIYGKTIALNANDPLTVSDIPLQTWNNVVINSDKGAVDIFINNKLIYTGHHVPTTNESAPHAVNNITVGQADGVHGEMCNVVLNTAPFTKPEIDWLHKTNKALNPPVVGVNMDPLNQGKSASELATDAIDKDAPAPTPMPTYSAYGALTYGIIGAVIGAIFGFMSNQSSVESLKGFFMGAIVFGLIGALLGAIFSTDGTGYYILKTIANVFVDTF
jgi:hypothetical protein